MLDTWLFAAFSALAIGGALGTVTRPNPVHAAVSLIVSLLGAAGLFLLLQAEFIFAAQVVLYVGGVMVLFLFVIMLVNLETSAQERQFTRAWPLAALCFVGLAAEMGWLLWRGAPELPPTKAAATDAPGNVELFGDVLFTRYLVPFEVASVLLLVAVVGAVLMARRES